MAQKELELLKSEFKNMIINLCHASREMGQDYVRTDPIINQKIDEMFNYYVRSIVMIVICQ